jgi:transposase
MVSKGKRARSPRRPAVNENSRTRERETIGIDLGDRQSDLCVVDGSGELVARTKAATTRPGLTRSLKRYPGSRVIIEVGTHSPWVSRLLEGLGHEVVVANAGRVRRIAEMEDKSDKIDAELLARLGRVDVKILRPIKHRGEQVQRDRALLRVRDELVRARTSLVTQARGIAKSLGDRMPRCDAQSFAKRLDRDELRDLFPGLGTLVKAVGELTRQIKALDGEIEEVIRQRYPETRQMRQVTGVGPITSLTYAVTIEDPERFARSRDVGPYIGLRPKRRQSGKADPELRISKAGDPYLRRTLVQAAHYIIGVHGPDTALRRFGERIKSRGGRSATKRAAVAVARKLAVLLHRLWVTKEKYEPLRGVWQADAN